MTVTESITLKTSSISSGIHGLGVYTPEMQLNIQKSGDLMPGNTDIFEDLTLCE